MQLYKELVKLSYNINKLNDINLRNKYLIEKQKTYNIYELFLPCEMQKDSINAKRILKFIYNKCCILNSSLNTNNLLTIKIGIETISLNKYNYIIKNGDDTFKEILAQRQMYICNEIFTKNNLPFYYHTYNVWCISSKISIIKMLPKYYIYRSI